jgi:hypothetical protein
MGDAMAIIFMGLSGSISEDAIGLVIFLIVAPALILGQIYLLGVKLSEPEKMIRPLDGSLSEANQARLLSYKDWLASANLQYHSSFWFGTIQAVVFQNGDASRFFLFHFHKRLTYAAESYLADLTVLDTGASASIGLMPRPGAYAQAFPGATPEEVWQRHLEGEAHLSAKFRYDWRPLNRDYVDILIDAARLRMQFVRSQFLWPARVLYRFAVTRHKLVNKTIAEQFP